MPADNGDLTKSSILQLALSLPLQRGVETEKELYCSSFGSPAFRLIQVGPDGQQPARRRKKESHRAAGACQTESADNTRLKCRGSDRRRVGAAR